MDYAKADALLQGRCKDRRKVANNTYLERRREGVIALKLHETDVLTFIKQDDSFPKRGYPERVKFDTGGWRTVVTKDRINRFAPGVTVWSSRGVWHAGVSGVGGPQDTVIFNEGMIWDGNRFHGDKSKDEHKAEKKERRDVSKYAKLYIDALEAGKVPAPGPGDCFFCIGLVQNIDGSTSTSKDHLQAHVKESYFVPRLLHNVLFNEGTGASQSMKAWVSSFWWDDAKEWRRWGERTRVEKALRKYVLKSLGHAA